MVSGSRSCTAIFVLGIGLIAACGGQSVRHEPGGAGTSGGGPSSGGTSGSGGAPVAKDCTYASIAQLCVVGDGEGENDRLVAGAPLRVRVTPSRCVSVSCTDAVIDSVSVVADDDFSAGHFLVSADLCFAPNDAAADPSSCTPCDDYHHVETTELTLDSGTNVVALGGLQVTFEVPSIVPSGTLCTGLAR